MKAFVKVVMLTVTINTTNNVMRYNVLTIWLRINEWLNDAMIHDDVASETLLDGPISNER